MIKILGLATPGAKCGCEAEFCHPNSGCQTKADFQVLIFGIKTQLCGYCLKEALEHKSGEVCTCLDNLGLCPTHNAEKR